MKAGPGAGDAWGLAGEPLAGARARVEDLDEGPAAAAALAEAGPFLPLRCLAAPRASPRPAPRPCPPPRRRGRGAYAAQLTGTLNGFFLGLVRALHARSAEVLFYAGDALVAFLPVGPGRGLAEAARLAAEAALEIAALRFERRGLPLHVHTGVGAGELEGYAAGEAGRAAALVFGGDLVRQGAVRGAGGVERDGDRVLGEARALLAPLGAFAFEPRGPHFLLAAAQPRPRPAPAPAPARPAPAGPRSGPRRRARDRAVGGPRCLLASVRHVYVVFASFPGLAATAQAGAENCARFEPVVRRLFAAAADYGGSLNKVFVDEKGVAALLGFGLPGHAHEDGARPAPAAGAAAARPTGRRRGAGVRAALALEAAFAEAGEPFAAAVAGGKAFCGPLGAPCRQEYAIVGDCVILAVRGRGGAGAGASHGRQARVMAAARKAVLQLQAPAGPPRPGPRRRAARPRRGAAAAAVRASRRRAAVSLEPRAAVAAKGFPDPVVVFRAAAAAEEPDGRPEAEGEAESAAASSAAGAATPRSPGRGNTSARLSSRLSGRHSARRGARRAPPLVGREEELGRRCGRWTASSSAAAAPPRPPRRGGVREDGVRAARAARLRARGAAVLRTATD
eukprot:tig00001307_g8115.t1